MSSEQSAEFDLNEFYDILTSINIKEKLKTFVRHFKKKNLPFIYQTMVNIIQVFNSKKQMPLMKFNALMAIKLFFDTGEYIPIILTEIYLLPIIFQVAMYRIQKRSQEGLTLYFIEKGYDSTKQMKRIGFNYVLLALEFIFMSAQVKPFRNLQKKELKQMSSYAKYAKLLLQKGVQPIQTYKFYLPSYVNQSRKRYMKKLIKFNPEEYIDFFVRMVCQQLNLNKKPQLDLKKLMSFGDAFITIPIMNICEEELDQMDNNFINKKKYLNLLGDFMRAGDIYALLIITRSNFLEQIYQKVQAVKGELGLDVGERTFPEVEASKADKRQFYVQYLKHLEIWASCHPVDQDGEPTVAKKIFDVLKRQRKFVFPPNILLNKIKGEMELNLKLNQQRNEQMIKLVDEGSTYQSRKKNGSMKESRGSRKSEKVNRSSLVGSYIEFDEVQEMVVKAKKKLNFIIQKEKLPQTIAFLQRFKRFWDAISEKNEIDVDQSGDIDIVLEQGTLCVKIVEMILPVYYLYNKQMISFEEYLDRVNLLMKTEEPESEKADISIEKDLPQQSVQEIETIKEESQDQRSSIMSKIKGSSLMQSKIKSKQPNLIEQQGIIEEGSKVSQVSDLSKLKLNSFNDYQLPTHKNSYENENKMIFSKESSELKEENHSNVSSMRNSRNSRKILERRGLKKREKQQVESENEKQVTYRDIINKKENNNSKLNFENSKQSFISSENSSLKSNEQKNNKSSLLIKNKTSNKSSKLKKDSKISQNQENFKDSYFDDYYGDASKKQEILIHKPSKLSSNFHQEPSKRSRLSKVKEKSLKSSIISKKSEIKQYNSGSFEILSNNLKDQYENQTQRRENLKKQSKFTFTSKDPNEIGSFENLKDVPLSILSKFDREESVIQAPMLGPLLHSFHEIKDDLNTNPSKISTFKDCFDIKNEIISAKQSTSRMFKFSKTGKIVNFVQTMYSRQTPKNSTIIDMLSERNAKQSIQFYRNEKQKIRQAETLSQRVKSLQSFNKNMRMKFVMRRQQQIPKILQNRSPKSTRQQFNPNDSDHVSFYPQSQTSKQQSDTNLMLKPYKTANNRFKTQEKMRTINTNIYQSYFPQQVSQKLKKCMLRSKGLLHKTQEFEIGSVVNRRESCLEYFLFLTPLKDRIDEIQIGVSHDQNVNIKISKKYVEAINVNQQQYINLIISIENVPYVLPNLTIKFKKNRQYAHNQLIVTLPCSFNKFFTYNSVTQSFTQQFQNNTHDFIHIPPYKYSTKILNPNKLLQNFGHFSVISSQGKSFTYATETYFKGKIFMLKFITNSRGSMQMHGKNMTGDHKNTKYLEFLMITFRKILQTLKK